MVWAWACAWMSCAQHIMSSCHLLMLCLVVMWFILSCAHLCDARCAALCLISISGPYTLVSSAVAADLGSHPSLKGNPNAMATVTGIIDGTGSVGSALQGTKEWDGMRWRRCRVMAWDGSGDGMRCDAMRCDGMGCDVM